MNDRELRFRIWDKKMIDIEQGIAVMGIPGLQVANLKEHSVMQFTGMFDAVDTPIYECDILTFINDPEKERRYDSVTWEQGGFWFYHSGLWDYADNAITNKLDKLLVVGNVYDNSELLDE